MTESTVVLTYGPSGVGKTTDQGYSFPCALFAAAPGALNSIQSVCGYTPATTQVATLMDATSLLRDVKGKFKVLVIDDFSFLAEQTFSVLENKKSGFKLWGALRDAVLSFRDAARFAGIHVVLNAWEQAPKTSYKGEKIRGGPRLSGNMPEQVPALCDVVLRACHDLRRQPWPAVYRCYLDPSWIMKDRHNIASTIDPAPMNLGELLRAAGIQLDRHPELPEQEDLVEAIAESFLGMDGFAAATANNYYTKLVESGMSVTAATWTLRDAMDRAEIRKTLSAAQSTFIDVNQTSLL